MVEILIVDIQVSLLSIWKQCYLWWSNRQFENGSVYAIATAYDSTNGKVVIAYNDSGSSDYGTAIVGHINLGDME